MIKKIPTPPKKQVVVEERQSEYDLNLEAWISYLKNISDRVKIIKPGDKSFDLKKFKDLVCEAKQDLERDRIVGWPKESEIAFAAFVNSSNNSDPQWLIGDAWFFCFNDLAFGFNYFDVDSYFEDEEDDDSLIYLETYSLSDDPMSALTWEYITERIANKIKAIIEKVNVPKFKK